MRCDQSAKRVGWKSLLIAAAMIVAGTCVAAGPQTRYHSGVPYMSGGVGESEREAMLESGDDFNVWLWFIGKGTGEFLADVRVIIADMHDNPVLDTVIEGPWLFARLPPGKYTVRVPDGTRQTVAAVTNGHTVSIVEVDRPDERVAVHYLALAR